MSSMEFVESIRLPQSIEKSKRFSKVRIDGFAWNYRYTPPARETYGNRHHLLVCGSRVQDAFNNRWDRLVWHTAWTPCSVWSWGQTIALLRVHDTLGSSGDSETVPSANLLWLQPENKLFMNWEKACLQTMTHLLRICLCFYCWLTVYASVVEEYTVHGARLRLADSIYHVGYLNN